MSLTRNLLHLFQVDSQARGLRSRLDSAKRYLRTQTSQLEALQKEREQVENHKKHAQALAGTVETEGGSISERIEKLRDELNSAVTNKQYSALLSELNTLKTQRGELDDRILAEMETVERLNGQLEEIDRQIAERQKLRDLAAGQLREREAEVGQRLSELETERGQAAASVAPEFLAIFEEMAEIYDGESMAQVDEIDRRQREYACGACHMTLPFEHVALLLSDTKSLVRCNACARILYIQEETRGALSKQ